MSERAIKRNALVETRIECQWRPSNWEVSMRAKSLSISHDEAEARLKEERCREFNDFIRDHRSQDDIKLHVERVFEDQCSACHNRWEIGDIEGLECCLHCGAPTYDPDAERHTAEEFADMQSTEAN